jgi:uncharacterized protein YjbI with pentapeptide repeats
MDRDETVALFLQGREAWNAWAEKRFAERRRLEAEGIWKLHPGKPVEGENPETQAWLEKAFADFSRSLFPIPDAEEMKQAPAEETQGENTRSSLKSIKPDAEAIDFSGFVFPDDASFESAIFSGYARFGSVTFSGEARFENASFSGYASFMSTTFSGYAGFKNATFYSPVSFGSPIPSTDGQFKGATFSSYASFEGAIFSGTAWFQGAKFSGDAWFDSTAFSGDALFDGTVFSNTVRFNGATFSDYASFKKAAFSGDAWFERTTFSDAASFRSATFSKAAQFRSATFKNYTSFRQAEFREDAILKGIKVERAFNMIGVIFKEVPAFNQADFTQAPDLDDVRFPLPGFWRRGDAKQAARYRAIRRMAIQGADYEREQMAYKGELRARRWTVDKWWSAGTWIGLFYDAFADCGRSIVRPANAWLASILLFAAFYWQRAAAGVEARCEEAGGAAVQALFLSVKNALVIFGGTRDARVNQAYLCLYNGSAEQPHIPPTVTFVETLAQIPVSATLIFLFLLAVKNRFKIK